MNARLRLAIYAKLHQIYGASLEAEKFLSFPREMPEVLKPGDLSMMLRPDVSEMTSGLKSLSSFSRMVNTPVRGMIRETAATEELLWNVYNEVLTTAEVAMSNKPEDAAALKAARERLYSIDEDGLTTKTERYTNYLTLMDRRYATEEKINNLRDSGASSAELEKAASELNDIKAALALGDLEKEINDSLQIIKRVTANSPSVAWEALRNSFISDVHITTDLENVQFAPTYLFPPSAMDEDWDTITLTRADMAALIQDANPQLQKVFSINDGMEDPDSVTFEYRSVKVERPWIEMGVFNSRFWRFPPMSGQEALSYPEHNGTGRFPAYIAAMILIRNLTLSDGSVSINEGRAMAMAYLCKWLPASPNPAPDAEWQTSVQTASFTLNQSAGGVATAKQGGHAVGSGMYAVGEKIIITAKPEGDFILDHWVVNGKDVPSSGGVLNLTMAAEGLSVTPLWALAEKSDNMSLEISGKTLVRISGGPNVLDMNAFKALCDIEAIGEDAFSNYQNLSRITIGAHVATIARYAFRGCRKLEHVTVPAATRAIHNDAFRRDNQMNDPIIKVDPDNEAYTMVDGVIVNRYRTTQLHTIRCKCGVSYFFTGALPSACPSCGASFDASTVTDKVVQKPDEVVPFKVIASEAEEKVRAYIKGKKYALPAFREAVVGANLNPMPLYVPHWEWNMQAKGTYQVAIKKEVKTAGAGDGANATGEAVKTEEEIKTVEVSCPEEMFLVPASKVIQDHKGSDAKGREKMEFSTDITEPFEEYSINSQQSLASARSLMNNKLMTKRMSEIPIGEVKHEEIEYLGERSSLVALPVWTTSINWGDKRYVFFVDAYKGTVSNKNGFPKDKKKIWKTVGIWGGIVALIVLLLIIIL